MSIHTKEHEPTFLTPQELLLSRLPGLLSVWQHDRDGGTPGNQTAQDLVATWSGLQRLVLPEPPSEALRRLDEVIREDAARFLDAIVSHCFDCESWLREMEKLDIDWDLGREEAEDLEWRTREAFDALDRTELFAWFAGAKVSSDARIQTWLKAVPESCERAEGFIADRPDLFLCLATDLAAVIASTHPGLEETDPLLWETLGKHRRIEEARDEVELAPSHHAVLAGVPRGARGLPKPIAVDSAYRLRDNQFWYSDCTFGDLVKDKARVTVRIEGLGIRTLSHAAKGKDGRVTPSFTLPERADRVWWKKERHNQFRVELLSIDDEAPLRAEKPSRAVSGQATIPPVQLNELPDPATIAVIGNRPSQSVLCVGLDIAWFGGSAGEPDSQYDSLGWVCFRSSQGQPAKVAFGFQRIPLQNRDPEAHQLVKAITTLLNQHDSIKKVVFALDAPIQAVSRPLLPVRVGNPPPGAIKRRACEDYFSRCRQLIDRKAGAANGWHPNILAGAPLAPRVVALLDGLKQLGFHLWTTVNKGVAKVMIECFPAEAIWAMKRLNRYPTEVTPDEARAYKKQKGNHLTAQQVQQLTHTVLDPFAEDSGNVILWRSLVAGAIDWMLADRTWQAAPDRYRGGKLLDDVVDTMICLSTSLSYVHGQAHIWQDPKCPEDGHIIGPGILDGVLS